MTSQVLQRQSYKAGDRIFKEGDEGSLAYVVQDGEVEIVKVIDGRETVLGSVGKGGIFGEMALIDNKPRMASARAYGGPVSVFVVSQAQFAKMLDPINPFVRKLLDILVNLVREGQQSKERPGFGGKDEPAEK